MEGKGRWGTICDLLSGESVERADGNVQQSVDTGQELRRRSCQRERLGGVGGWMRRSHRPGSEHLCRGGE